MVKILEIFWQIIPHLSYIINQESRRPIGNFPRYNYFLPQVSFEQFCCQQLMSEKCCKTLQINRLVSPRLSGPHRWQLWLAPIISWSILSPATPLQPFCSEWQQPWLPPDDNDDFPLMTTMTSPWWQRWLPPDDNDDFPLSPYDNRHNGDSPFTT